jgi:hypothetical protein
VVSGVNRSSCCFDHRIADREYFEWCGSHAWSAFTGTLRVHPVIRHRICAKEYLAFHLERPQEVICTDSLFEKAKCP